MRPPPLATRLPLAGLAMLASLALDGPADLAAQNVTLDRVDSLVAAADYEAARSAIEAWWAESQTRRIPGSEQARALLLRAQLAPDHAEAEPHYLSIVLGYPITPEAPRALLRLGQGLLMAGDVPRAVGYLQRYVADYPGHPERTIGLLWLARARNAARQSGTACGAAREGLLDARDPDLVAMLRAEENVGCDGGGAGTPATPAPARQAAQPPTATTQPAPTQPAPTQPAPTQPTPRTGTVTPGTPHGPDAAAGRFTAQVGAYRQQQSVDDIVARLRRAGYEPRVVLMPGSSLMRVRVGRFVAHSDAARLVARLGASGFDAVAVGDGDQERQP